MSPSQTTGSNTGSVLGLNQTGLNLGIAGAHSLSLLDRQFLLPQLALEEACLLRYFVEDLAKGVCIMDYDMLLSYADKSSSIYVTRNGTSPMLFHRELGRVHRY